MRCFYLYLEVRDGGWCCDVMGCILWMLLNAFQRFVLTKFIFNPLAEFFGVYKESFKAKLIENLWYICYYPTMITIAFYILRDSKFFPWDSVCLLRIDV